MNELAAWNIKLCHFPALLRWNTEDKREFPPSDVNGNKIANKNQTLSVQSGKGVRMYRINVYIQTVGNA
jgi:hypothetical protein